MKAFICLAISMLLIGLLYVYMRQQLASLETHVNALKVLIREVSDMTVKQLPETPFEAFGMPFETPFVNKCEPIKERKQQLVCVSDDESDDESVHPSSSNESDDESIQPVRVNKIEEPALEIHELNESIHPMQINTSSDEEIQISDGILHEMQMPVNVMQMIQQMTFQYSTGQPTLEIEELPEESKVVVLDSAYDLMSVKELRDLVRIQGGPSFKTKKQLVEFLEKNVSA